MGFKAHQITLGNKVTLLKNPFYAIGLYKYVTGAYWDKNTAYVQLGCYLRTREEWEKDFWNNPSEFTNPEAPESKQRMFAFKIACLWLDENKPIIN